MIRLGHDQPPMTCVCGETIAGRTALDLLLVHQIHQQTHTNNLLEAIMSTITDLTTASSVLADSVSRLAAQTAGETVLAPGQVAVEQTDLDAAVAAVESANTTISSLLTPATVDPNAAVETPTA